MAFVPTPFPQRIAPRRATSPRTKPRMSTQPRPLPGQELIRPRPDEISKHGPLSPEQVNAFFTDGFIVVKGLLSPDLFQRLQHAKQHADNHRGVQVGSYDRLSFRVWEAAPVFKEAAIDSGVPAAVAQLLPRGPKGREIVVVNDAYFRMKGDNKGCNFHVDDSFFWPCPQGEPGPGVNAWIAMDRVTEDGGGLAVAPGSFTEEYLECRDVIKKGGTCLIDKLDPALSQKLENIAVKPVMDAGDVILCTRWLFHRGDPFKDGTSTHEGIARYSVRYMPGNAFVAEKKIVFAEGKMRFESNDPIALSDADPDRFPAVRNLDN